MLALQAYAFASAMLFSAASVFFDLRERRIPNPLNALGFAAALAFAAASGRQLFEFLIFSAAAFAFAYLLYRLGVWAGGDAKFFTALLAFMPVVAGSATPFFGLEKIVFVFLASAAFCLPLLAAMHCGKILGLRPEFFSAFSSSVKPALFGAAFSSFVYFAYSAIFGLVSEKFFELLPSAFTIALAMSFAFSFSAKSFAIISKKVLRREVPVSSLREGDIPAQSVFLRSGRVQYWEPPSVGQLLGNALKLDSSALAAAFPPKGGIVSCLSARGVSADEIVNLKKVGVKHLVVKQSIPFAPAVALGFAAVAWFA